MSHRLLLNDSFYLNYPYFSSLISFLLGLISGIKGSSVLLLMAALYLFHLFFRKRIFLFLNALLIVSGWVLGTLTCMEVKVPFPEKSVVLISGMKYMGGEYFKASPGKWGVLWKGKRYIPRGSLFIRSKRALNEKVLVECSLKVVTSEENGFRRYLFGEGYSFICDVRNVIAYSGDRLSFFRNASLFQGITRAIVYGEKFTLPSNVKEVFRRSGMAHLLAISGFHLLLLYLFAYTLIRALAKLLATRIRFIKNANLKEGALIFSLCVSFIYLHIAGYPVSAVRAFSVMSAYVLAEIMGVNIFTFEAVAFLALCFLFLHPYLIYSVSFALSFLAFTGIVLTYGKYGDISFRIPRVFRFPLLLLITTLSAVVFTLPATVTFFKQINFAGVISNFIGVPAFYVVIPLSIIGEAMPLFKPLIAVVVTGVMKVLLKIIFWLIPVLTSLVFSVTHPWMVLGPFVLVMVLGFTRKPSAAFAAFLFTLWAVS